MRDDVYLSGGQKTRIRRFFRTDVDRWQEWPDHPDPLYAAYNPKPMQPPMRDVWYRNLVERQRQQPFAVEDLDGRMIGRIFLRHVDRSEALAVLGIDFHPDFVGRGYGSDALRAFLCYYFAERGFRHLLLTVAVYNTRARRLYRSFGFKSIGTHWGRHDARVRPLLSQPAYRALRGCFRQTARGLEARFEDMVLTAERFAALEAGQRVAG